MGNWSILKNLSLKKSRMIKQADDIRYSARVLTSHRRGRLWLFSPFNFVPSDVLLSDRFFWHVPHCTHTVRNFLRRRKLITSFIKRSHSKSKFVVEGEGILEKQTKMNREVESSFPVHLLYEKDCLIFQTTNRVISDKLLDSF